MRPARVLDYLFFLRPVLLAPVWTVYLLGLGEAKSRPDPDPLWWLGLLSLTAAFGGVFVLNQYFDRNSDARNHKCLFLPSGRIGRKAALWFYVALNLIALGGLFAAGRTAPYVLLVPVLGAIYSAPPWRWKDRPYLALACNVLAHGLLVFMAGRIAAGFETGSSGIASLPYVSGVAAVYLLTTIPDLEGDRGTGKRTLAVTLGPERAARWALGWYLSALLLAVYAVDVLFVLAVLPAAPAFVKAGGGDLTRVRGAVRWSVAGLSCAAAWLVPWYALVLFLGFWATRAYYRRTWGCVYP